jgi:glutathione S-transferase
MAATDDGTPLVEIGYWNIRGLGAPLRMMAMFAKLPFRVHAYALDEKFDRTVWTEGPKVELKKANPFMNLPYVVDGDRVITQSNSCLAYLGRKTGLWGKTEDEIVLCETLLCEIYDIRNAVVRFSYPATPEQAAPFIDGVRSGSLAKLEQHLKNQREKSLFSAEKPFLACGRATAPDFHLWELLDQILTACAVYKHLADPAEFFAGLENIQAFFEGFGKLEAMQAYLGSSLHRMPFNNLPANFGSMDSAGETKGAKWTPEKPLPEANHGKEWSFSF